MLFIYLFVVAFLYGLLFVGPMFYREGHLTADQSIPSRYHRIGLIASCVMMVLSAMVAAGKTIRWMMFIGSGAAGVYITELIVGPEVW